MLSLQLSLFAFLWIAIVYFFNCAISRSWKRIEPKYAILYITTVAMIGIFGELFVDTVYNAIFGHALWLYRFWPIQGGFTSHYSPVIWGIYGFHLYLFHGTMELRSITRARHLALIFCFEAIIFEALLTISAYFLLGNYMYYYHPGDLWHVTSIQNIPLYYICGVIIVKTLRRFKADPWFFSAMCTGLVATALLIP